MTNQGKVLNRIEKAKGAQANIKLNKKLEDVINIYAFFFFTSTCVTLIYSKFVSSQFF